MASIQSSDTPMAITSSVGGGGGGGGVTPFALARALTSSLELSPWTLFLGSVTLFFILSLWRDDDPKKQQRKNKNGRGSSSSSLSSSNPDAFKTIDELRSALAAVGFETAALTVGVDCTASNEMMGLRTHGGRSLHSVSGDGLRNPYEQAMLGIIETMQGIDSDDVFPMYMFGSDDTRDKSVRPFHPSGEPGCRGLTNVLETYRKVIPGVRLAGPTSFAPLIHKVIESARGDPSMHQVLVILTDGAVNDGGRTEAAIREASNHRISIIAVGVGDGENGNWETMERFDDRIRGRRFDNFQFVRFEPGMADFGLHALMELPAQYAAALKI